MFGNLISDPKKHFPKLVSVRKSFSIDLERLYNVIEELSGHLWSGMILCFYVKIVEKLYLIFSRGGTRSGSGRMLLSPRCHLVSK